MKIALKIILPIAILVVAVLGFKFLGTLKPAPQSRQPEPVVPVVELVKVSPADHAPPVLSYGTVGGYFETGLTAQVSGVITFVSPKFRTGEKAKAGDLLVKIDPRDYDAALAREEANLTVAERTYAEEEILAEQAAGDWEASGRDLAKASDFVLRKPQLAAAQASIVSAKASVAKAQADLERTEVRAPFDAIVTARSASPGNRADAQVVLGTLVSTERVEIRLPLTASQAVRVGLPAKAVLTSPLKPGVEWEATLVRMDPTVDRQNQVVFAVAEVEDPFAEGREPLPVGIFANASIEALPIGSSYEIPEAALVSDSYVWTVNGEGVLERVGTERLYSQGASVFVKMEDGMEGELRIVSRPLSNFRNGAKVKTVDE